MLKLFLNHPLIDDDNRQHADQPGHQQHDAQNQHRQIFPWGTETWPGARFVRGVASLISVAIAALLPRRLCCLTSRA